MNIRHLALMLSVLAIAAAESPSKAIVTNLDTASWTREKGAPADTESVMLHRDQTSGGMDLLVRFPGGHVVKPHWHESDERIFLAEGQLTLRQDDGDKILKPGAFALLPAREVQRLSCSSQTRCTFYLSWDGKPESHAAK